MTSSSLQEKKRLMGQERRRLTVMMRRFKRTNRTPIPKKKSRTRKVRTRVSRKILLR